MMRSVEVEPRSLMMEPLPGAIARAFDAAIWAAARHIGATAPNPPVGCAILDEAGEILATGAHPRAGAPHAEAMALLACREAGRIERARVAVVTLEPCNHTGRTGPCTAAILDSPIRSVWVGADDPNPHVAGGGAAFLRAAGVLVRHLDPDSRPGRDCAALIAPFRRAATRRLPWVTVKQALDSSGSMIPPRGATTFTGPEALRLAHRLRRATDAIVTGMGTILADRPSFTVRQIPDHPDRRRYLGVVSRDGGVPEDYRREAEARGWQLRTDADPRRLLERLAADGVLWAMVEAGPGLLARIEPECLWDDWVTIRQDSVGRDHVSVRSTGGISPLRLIEGLGSIEGMGSVEVACSPAS